MLPPVHVLHTRVHVHTPVVVGVFFLLVLLFVRLVGVCARNGEIRTLHGRLASSSSLLSSSLSGSCLQCCESKGFPNARVHPACSVAVVAVVVFPLPACFEQSCSELQCMGGHLRSPVIASIGSP